MKGSGIRLTSIMSLLSKGHLFSPVTAVFIQSPFYRGFFLSTASLSEEHPDE